MNRITEYSSIGFEFLDSHSAPDDSISAISLMRRICDALPSLSQPVIVAEGIIFKGDEVVRIHYDASWVFSRGHNLGILSLNYHNWKNMKSAYIVAYLPPGNCWNGFMFPWLMFIFICTVHGSEVLVSVDSAPPDRGLVHVLIIRHPHVKLVGVIELAAKGDLSLQKNIHSVIIMPEEGLKYNRNIAA